MPVWTDSLRLVISGIHSYILKINLSTPVLLFCGEICSTHQSVAWQCNYNMYKTYDSIHLVFTTMECVGWSVYVWPCWGTSPGEHLTRVHFTLWECYSVWNAMYFWEGVGLLHSGLPMIMNVHVSTVIITYGWIDFTMYNIPLISLQPASLYRSLILRHSI